MLPNQLVWYISEEIIHDLKYYRYIDAIEEGFVYQKNPPLSREDR